MKNGIPPMDESETEELGYVRSLCRKEIDDAERFFGEKYPSGTPFLPSKDDLDFLNDWEGECISRIMAGRDRYPEWLDYDIAGLVAIVRMSVMMRFARVKREVTRSDWNIQVEAIIEHWEATEAPAPAPTTETELKNTHNVVPFLRLVRNTETGPSQ